MFAEHSSLMSEATRSKSSSQPSLQPFPRPQRRATIFYPERLYARSLRTISAWAFSRLRWNRLNRLYAPLSAPRDFRRTAGEGPVKFSTRCRIKERYTPSAHIRAPLSASQRNFFQVKVLRFAHVENQNTLKDTTSLSGYIS